MGRVRPHTEVEARRAALQVKMTMNKKSLQGPRVPLTMDVIENGGMMISKQVRYMDLWAY